MKFQTFNNTDVVQKYVWSTDLDWRYETAYTTLCKNQGAK